MGSEDDELVLHFALLSGQEVEVEAEADELVDAVLNRAQRALRVLLVAAVNGGAMLDVSRSLREEGVKDGDRLVGIVDRSDPPLQWHSKSFVFVALREDGRLIMWGDERLGAYEVPQLQGVEALCTNSGAVAALLQDGRVVTWGEPAMGGGTELVEVVGLCATAYAFAAVKRDGSVACWGEAAAGGDCRGVQERLRGVRQISGASWAFAAVCEEGVVTWGDERKGGDCQEVQDRLVEVTSICASSWAFAALKADGRVVTWGVANKGGDSRQVQEQLVDVLQLRATSWAFCALRADGRLVCWGDPSRGGECAQMQSMQSICQVCACADAFACLDRMGMMRIWGDPSLAMSATFVAKSCTLTASSRAFAALKDGTLRTFGDRRKGGHKELQQVVEVVGSSNAFCALMDDGSVSAFGEASAGGDVSEVKDELREVVKIFA